MKKNQFDESIRILRKMLEEGETVVFSGKSLADIIYYFHEQLFEAWDENQRVDELLIEWQANIKAFKGRLIANAKNESSYSLFNNKMVPLITEEIAGITIDYCRSKNPPGPILY